MTEEDYDVVIDALQKQRDILWKMTQQNMNADMFNIMDQIRLEQIDQLDKAMVMWKKSKEWKSLQSTEKKKQSHIIARNVRLRNQSQTSL